MAKLKESLNQFQSSLGKRIAKSTLKNELTKLREQLPPMLRALDVGIPAGFLFDYLHTPIPWIIGPMIAVAAFNLMGAHILAALRAEKARRSFRQQLRRPAFQKRLSQRALGLGTSLVFRGTPQIFGQQK